MGNIVSVLTSLPRVIVGLVEGLISDSRLGNIVPNPVMEELEQRIRDEQRRAEEAEAARRRAEYERTQAEEERRQAEENARRVEDDRMAAEKAREKAEDDAKRANEERRRAEEEKHQAEEDRRVAEEARNFAEEVRKKAEEDSAKMNEDKIRANEEAANARFMQEKAELERQAADRQAAEARAAFEEVQRKLREGIKPIIIPTKEQFEAAKKRLKYQEGIFHFAIAGNSGGGKSSLINAFRGLRNNSKSPSLALVGVTETTSKVTRYADPNNANPFVWYDVPGAGTLDIPDYEYFNDQGLYIFDCIIVLFDSRFMATDIAILRNCARFNIPAYIVRSKSTQHIRNLESDLSREVDETEDSVYRRARTMYIQETYASVARKPGGRSPDTAENVSSRQGSLGEHNSRARRSAAAGTEV
ncbi:uncharacterized protein FIBRA_00025 [Fibroporia radiculosa]|uniref:IRG-type G domain-containing protein n=1 Tax=Fibroporia radiculosa TaxID=599839 RepID=J7RG01_9APHY|nr:uncharacterized protein FIBRA_00025 [Fibroporia radiculosa]CCL98032.1 predicted protein [Fibroporia radiculosa]